MKDIYVNIEGNILGPFSDDQCRRMLSQKHVSPNALCKKGRDSTKWIHIRELISITAPLNSATSGEFNWAPFLAASFVEETVPFGKRLNFFGQCLFISLFLLIIPVIGWFIAIVLVISAFAALFDGRPIPKTWSGKYTRVLGDFRRDGYRDRFNLFLGGSLLALGGGIFYLIVVSTKDVSQGLWLPGGILMGGFIAILKYFIPRHER